MSADGGISDQEKGMEEDDGLLRLHEALSNSALRRRSSYEAALNVALREVQENEDVTEDDILEKLMSDSDARESGQMEETLNPIRKWSSISGRSGQGSSSGLKIQKFQIPQISVTDDANETISAGEDEVKDETMQTRDHGSSYQKLCDIANALKDGGRSGLEALQRTIERDNLQTGLDKVFSHVLHTFHDQWSRLFEYLVPWQQLQAMLLIFCFQLINIQQIIKFVPIFSCYVSFFIMIYCTLKIIHSRYWHKQAKVWRRLLRTFQFARTPSASNVRTHDFQSFNRADQNQNYENTEEPYGNYFLALVIFVFSFALTDRRTTPNVFPMCALSIFFSLTSVISLLEKEHYGWVRAIMAADLFATSPLILKRIFHWRLWKIFGNIINIRIGALKIGFGLSSLSSVTVYLLYFYMACISNSKNSIRLLIMPHLICFSWWHTGLELFSVWNLQFEWRHVLLTAVIIWLILCPTWTAASACVLVVALQMRNILDAFSILKILSISFIFCLPYAYKRMVKRIEQRGHSNGTTLIWTTEKRKIIYIYMGLVLILMAILYGGRESPDVLKRKISNLTWSEFHQRCSSFNTDKHKGNLLQQQIDCSEFGSTVVEWSGQVEKVKIVNIENFLESIFYYLPDSIAQKFRCLYGTKANAFNGTTSTGKTCSVAQYNVYTFEIEVKGPWIREKANDGKIIEKVGRGIAVVEASDVFEEISLDLQSGDLINFTAILDDDILNYPPRLSLLQIECMKCPWVFANRQTTRVVSEAFYSEDHWFWTKLYNACRFVFNFVCAPFLMIE